MTPVIVAVIAVIIIVICRILNINGQPEKPVLVFKDGKFTKILTEAAPDLLKPYVPTRIWGFNGHVQTVLHSIIGRIKCPWTIGERVFLNVADGSTLTYDLYQPLEVHSSGDDVTLAVCPGICNSSESVYIRTFVHTAQKQGYRCVVLNHIGALKTIKVTSHRVFAYGCTRDFHSMLSHMQESYPQTKIVLVGFSMGGNIVTKYLGEPQTRVPNIVGGISICQGYDALGATRYLLQWANFRRVYLYVMTESMKRVLIAHHSSVLNDEVKNKYQLCERTILSAATLPELDDAYSRRILGYKDISEFYEKSSCSTYMDQIAVPMVFINALDDPIVPEALLKWPKTFAETKDSALYVQTAHGGHLGFYEGGFLQPNPVTWLDRTAVGLADGIVRFCQATKPNE